MSHEISNIDTQEGTTMAWHKLTKINPEITPENCWLSTWDVQKSPLFREGGSKTEWNEIVCTDNKSIIVGHPVSDSYSVIANERFLAIVGDAIDNINGSKIVSNGSVCERGRIFASVEVPEMKEFTAAGRKYVPYLNFLSSHDMSTPFVANASNVCTVCNNTFTMNLKDVKNKVFRVSVRHTKNANAKLADIDGLIDAWIGTQARFKMTMDRLAKKSADAYQAAHFFTGLLSSKINRDASKIVAASDDEELSKRRSGQVNRLVTLFQTGAGNRGENRADMFSAVTDYYSHESSGGRNPFKQVASSEFGAGLIMKEKALYAMENDDEYESVVLDGKMILKA